MTASHGSADRKHRSLVLFTFNLGQAYSFLAGVFVVLSVNLLTTILLRAGEVSSALVYLCSVALFVTAVALFSIGWNIEAARGQWLSEGAPSSHILMAETLHFRSHRLWLLLVVGVVALLIGVTALIIASHDAAPSPPNCTGQI